MSNLVFKTLYLFSSAEKKAKVVSFGARTNIITSSSLDGTKRGKSLITKCLYHTMGADCFFESMWNERDKTYILEFTIDGVVYYMYRFNSLFKLFDENKNVIFKTSNRNELGEKLKDIFHFAVQLPNREDGCLEIAPPVFNYLMYFLDQDRILGAQLASFDKLAQYADFKENTLYYHLGAFDERYYEWMQELKQVELNRSKKERERDISDGIYKKVTANIKDVSYAQNIDILRKDVDIVKGQYSIIANALNQVRTSLINLRNEKEEILHLLETLKLLDRDNESQIKKLNNATCPFCDSKLNDTISLRVLKYNVSEDIVLLTSSMQVKITEVEREISNKEEDYKKWLGKLNQYDSILKEKHGEISDALAHRGYVEIRDNLVEELTILRVALDGLESRERELKTKLKVYQKTKKTINERYSALMLAERDRFRLEEIKEESLQKITSIFKGGGSNRPITTVVWYVTLLKLKEAFNPTAIRFPIVFDSPNNAETDLQKKHGLYRYIVENVPRENQLIVSGIGYGDDASFGVEFEHIIRLENEPYHLLCREDYEAYSGLLTELSAKTS